MRSLCRSAFLIICLVGVSLAPSVQAGTLFRQGTRSFDDITLQKMGEYRYVYRFFFKLYDAALFVAPEGTSADVLARSVPFHLEFHYLRTIEKSVILESSDKMLAKNLSASERAQIQERVDRINAAYTGVKEGDSSSLTYLPGQGTVLRVNGQQLITIEGEDFAELYFRIWLGPHPISPELKTHLLGQN